MKIIACLILSLCLALPALAQAPAQPAARPETKAEPKNPPESAKKEDRAKDAPRTAVLIEHTGQDFVGAKLAYLLKEGVNKSSLFNLSRTDEKKIVLQLVTKEEFGDRPKSSCVYSAIWLYSYKDGSLKYYLTSEVGVADAASVGDTAEALLARTDQVAGTYAYLNQ